MYLIHTILFLKHLQHEVFAIVLTVYQVLEQPHLHLEGNHKIEIKIKKIENQGFYPTLRHRDTYNSYGMCFVQEQKAFNY